MFVYVYGTDMKDKLVALGYELIKSAGDIYIFHNKLEVNFDANQLEGKYVITDTLTF